MSGRIPSRGKSRREITEKQISDVVRWIVRQAIHGAGPFASASALATEYSRKHGDPEQAINALVRAEMFKIGTSGFLMGLPGFLALPVLFPATLGADYFVAARMVAAIAQMRGWNLQSDTVQACVLICLMGNHGKEVVKQTSRVAGVKAAQGFLHALSAKMIAGLPKAASLRLVSNVGERGALALTRAAPLVGGLIGGGIDAAFLAVCAKAAKEIFKPNHSGLMTDPEDAPHDFFELNGDRTRNRAS